MYLVNTSFFVDHSANDAWLNIIKTKYLPFLESSGYSIAAFTRVISNDPDGHFTYSLIVDAPDLESYTRLTEELFDEYRTFSDTMFGQKVTWFVSLMKKVDR